jgi:hypothetical protein
MLHFFVHYKYCCIFKELSHSIDFQCRGVIRGQTNIHEHDPLNCSSSYKDWGKPTGCPNPQFAGGGAQTWMWVIGPFVIYLLERILRIYRDCQKIVITKVCIVGCYPLSILIYVKGKARFGP